MGNLGLDDETETVPPVAVEIPTWKRSLIITGSIMPLFIIGFLAREFGLIWAGAFIIACLLVIVVFRRS